MASDMGSGQSVDAGTTASAPVPVASVLDALPAVPSTPVVQGTPKAAPVPPRHVVPACLHALFDRLQPHRQQELCAYCLLLRDAHTHNTHPTHNVPASDPDFTVFNIASELSFRPDVYTGPLPPEGGSPPSAAAAGPSVEAEPPVTQPMPDHVQDVPAAADAGSVPSPDTALEEPLAPTASSTDPLADLADKPRDLDHTAFFDSSNEGYSLRQLLAIVDAGEALPSLHLRPDLSQPVDARTVASCVKLARHWLAAEAKSPPTKQPPPQASAQRSWAQLTLDVPAQAANPAPASFPA